MTRYSARRFEERIIYKFPVVVRHGSNGKYYNARITNYSDGGLYIETDLELDVGGKINIRIKRSLNESLPYSSGHYMAKLVWRKALANSFFKYGYGATNISESASPNRQIGDSNARQELREYYRNTVYKPVFFYSRKRILDGYIYNLSRGGAFIRTKYSHADGEIIKIVTRGTDIEKGLMLKCEVKHSSRSGVGVKFKSLSTIKEIIGDSGGTRSGNDRRKIYTLEFSPDKRSGKDRRNGRDRRTFRFVHHVGYKLSAASRDLPLTLTKQQNQN